MKRLLTFLFLVVIVVGGVGFWRGWFTATKAEAGTNKIVFSWDPAKIKSDLSKAGQKAKALAKSAIDKVKAAASNKNELQGEVQDVNLTDKTLTLKTKDEQITLPLLNTEAEGLDKLKGKTVKVQLDKTDDGLFVRKIEELAPAK